MTLTVLNVLKRNKSDISAFTMTPDLQKPHWSVTSSFVRKKVFSGRNYKAYSCDSNEKIT
jgi:hypothetical protein